MLWGAANLDSDTMKPAGRRARVPHAVLRLELGESVCEEEEENEALIRNPFDQIASHLLLFPDNSPCSDFLPQQRLHQFGELVKVER